MDKDPKIFLTHILDSIALVEEYTAGKTKENFLHAVEFQDRVIHRIEIIGEATKNLSDILKNRYPDIPWRKIASMRDRIIHEYFGIDFGLTWDTVIQDLPKLKRQILAVKKDLEK